MSDSSAAGHLVAVVVPTYNEVSNVGALLTGLASLPVPRLRVFIVDDNSPDGTADEAERLSTSFTGTRPNFLTVVRRRMKDGLGRAYVAGMKEALAAGADIVVQMDADLSHQPQYIPRMIAMLVEEDADVVIGSRYVTGGSLADEWALPRRLLSAWANFYVNAILGMRIRDATAGFKVWRASMLGKIGLDGVGSQGYSFQVEMNYRTQRLGGKLVESPIHFQERNSGMSKMDFQAKWESAKMPFKLRWSADHPSRSTEGAAAV
jgi:dolichol-phosphate mannosyltransferase